MTFEKPGLYGFKCAPHYFIGMAKLIQVGDKPENLQEAKAVQHGTLAATRFEPLFEKVQ